MESGHHIDAGQKKYLEDKTLVRQKFFSPTIFGQEIIHFGNLL